MSDKDLEVELLKKHTEALGEHFDTVHIFATKYDAAVEEGTITYNYGSGNWYARYGQICEWMVKQNEVTRISERRKYDDNNP